MTKIYIASDVLSFFAIDERDVLVDKELYERKAQYVRRLFFCLSQTSTRRLPRYLLAT
jgi:hypothetical protein